MAVLISTVAGISASDKGTQEMVDEVERSTAEMVYDVESSITSMVYDVESSTATMVYDVESSTAEMVDDVERSTEEMVAQVETSTPAMVEGAERSTAEIVAEVERSTAEMVAQVESRTAEMVAGIEARTQEIVDNVESSTEETAETVQMLTGMLIVAGAFNSISEDHADHIYLMDSVETVAPIVTQRFGGSGGQQSNDYDYQIRGVPLDPLLVGAYPLLPSNIVTGRTLAEGDDAVVMLSVDLLDYFQAVVGDTITLEGVGFEVVGTYYQAMSGGDDRTVIMSLDNAQSLLNRGDNVSFLQVYTEPDADLDAVVNEIAQMNRGWMVLTIDQWGRQSGVLTLLTSSQEESLARVQEVASQQISALQESADAQIATIQESADAQLAAIQEGAASQSSTMQEEAAAQIAAIQEGAAAQITAIQDDADSQIATLQEDADSQIAAMQDDADSQIASMQEDADSQIAALKDDRSAVKGLGFQISIVVGIAGVLMIFGIMFYTVRERTREIGILKALGFSNLYIINRFMLEGSFIGLLGGLVGIALGAITFSLLGPWLLHINEDISMTFQPYYLLIGLGTSFLFGTLGSLYPAWHASRISPMEALRYG
ncbi:FtsX-like permease family protein [Chloroflexota bacterium]